MSEIECPGCSSGIKMCYHRPCWGTPEEFKKIIEAGFAHKLRMDYYVGSTLSEEDRVNLGLPTNPFKEDVYVLTGGTPEDRNYTAPFLPIGRCKLLTEDNKCSLHDLGLKPEQGRESCCRYDSAKDNIHYAHLWDTEEGKEVLELFRSKVF